MFDFDHKAIVDVGRGGISGFYRTAVEKFRSDLPQAITSIALWQVVSFWANTPLNVRLSPHLALFDIVNFLLFLWSASIWAKIAVGLWYGGLWLRLERKGMLWVRLNDQLYRVTYYRRDGSIRHEGQTRAARLEAEVSTLWYRRDALRRTALQFAGRLFVGALIRLGFDLLYELFGDDVRAFVATWHIEDIVFWLWFFLSLVPAVVELAMQIIEEIVYRSGAQFIPGPKVRDRAQPPKTLEMVRAQMVNGRARFVNPAEAARDMSR